MAGTASPCPVLCSLAGGLVSPMSAEELFVRWLVTAQGRGKAWKYLQCADVFKISAFKQQWKLGYLMCNRVCNTHRSTDTGPGIFI